MESGGVSYLLDNLKDLVVYNANLMIGAEVNVNTLSDELDKLKSYVKNCVEEKGEGDFLKELAENVRKLVYKAEDAIETYIVAFNRNRSRSSLRASTFDNAKELCDVRNQLESITKEVTELIAGGQVNAGIQAIKLSDEGPQKIDKKPVFDDSNDVVGLDGATEDVINLLQGGSEDFQTVSIVGMLGLGKTTLAKKIFKHPTVENKFAVRAFAAVSANYKAGEVFLDILNAIGIDTKEVRKHEDDYIYLMRGYLENRNFFIVLDDVWTQEAWDDLKRAFPTNQKHSRILITTRNKDVAEYARLGNEPYSLQCLNFDESQELLRKKVFGKEEFPTELEKPETLILGRCDGLPLSIVVVSGILKNHKKESYWWESIANATADQTTHMIELSFKHLLPHLKQCFLYLGVFCEGLEIPSKILFQLWVSEGFVPQANGEAASEDIAEHYLEELVERSLVMVEKRRLNGRIKSIRIHDIVLEFCKMQGQVEKLFRVIKVSEEGMNLSHDDNFRLCINSNVEEYVSTKPSGKYVRSFLTFSKDIFVLPIEQTSYIPKAFRFVRVLDIRSIKLTRFPAEMYNYLVLLKYLAMFSELRILPEKMTNLRYLQTIIFMTTQPKVEIKPNIWKMERLRYLVTNASATLPRITEDLPVNKNLHTLSVISAESCTKEVFDRAVELKKLAISGPLADIVQAATTGEVGLFDCLQKLEFLENLKLLNDKPAAKVHCLPSENHFPANLTRLTLKNTKLDWSQISTLGKLMKLEVLKLKENAFTGALWETENDGFHALKVLHIAKTDLAAWKASASHFPKLVKLHLMYCTKLEAIPSDLVNISSLLLIHMYRCNSALVSSARKLQGETNSSLRLEVYQPDE